MWLAVALLAIGMFVAGSFSYWLELQTPCLNGPEACNNEGLLTQENVRELREMGLSTGFHATFSVALSGVFAAVWCAVGAIIFLRRSDDWMALLVALFLVTFSTATFNTTISDALVADHSALWLPAKGMQLLGDVLVMLFFYLFPSGHFVPRWTRWLALMWILVQAPSYLSPADSPLNTGNWPDWLGFGVFTAFILSFVAAQIYRYRRVSGPLERRQTRWVVFGVTAAIVGLFAFLIPLIFTSSESHISYLWFIQGLGIYTSMTLIPLSIGVAMLRSRLFDIDRIINRALVYGALTITLGALYFGGVVALQGGFRALTGGESQLAVVASTLAIAAMFIPLRRRLQELIDRRFYRRKYDAERTLREFSARLQHEADLDVLCNDLIATVRETMQPEHVSLWLREPEKDK